MSSPRNKLALIAGVAVVAAMVMAAIAFNLFIGWKVATDAVDDVKEALSWETGGSGMGRAANYLVLDSAFKIKDEYYWGAGDEEQLAEWFKAHPETGVVSRVDLNGWTCYAAIAPLDEYDVSVLRNEEGFDSGNWDHRGNPVGWADSADEGYLIAYIDVTGELSMMTSVNVTFALIAVIGAAIAAAAGYFAGRSIERSQEAQKRFYENMSHDLKTPLAAIRGYAEGAESGVVETRAALSSIGSETVKMTGMIDEILGLSRLESGVVQLHRETVCVGDFVQDCLMPFEGAVLARGIAVELDLADGTIEADPGQFDHALSNVLSNAVRHAGAVVRVRYDGSSLSVWNDGDVPDDEQVNRLFERYYSGEGGSTGIGLAIAREIAEAHGWKVFARTKDGGLEISFEF